MKKIYNKNCNIEIYMNKKGIIFITAKRQVQIATGSRSYIGDYGSMACYEDDYEEFDYELEIELNELISNLEELDNFISDFEVNLESVEKVNELFEFIYNNTTYWNKIDEYLCETAQTSAENEREE